MNKTIAIKCSQNLGANAHGAESHTILSFARMLESAGFKVHLIGPEKYPEELDKYSIITPFKYFQLPSYLRKILHIPASFINLLYYLLRYDPNVVITVGGVFYNGFSVSLLCKLFNIKNVVRTAEDNFEYYKYMSKPLLKIKYFLFNTCLSKLVFKIADNVLTVGKESEKYFISKGVDENKITGLPGPIIRSRFYPIKKSDLHEFMLLNKIPLDKKIVLYVGALSCVKGADLLTFIIDEIVSTSNDYFFLIIGADTEGGGILSKLQEYSSNVLLILPPQDHENLCKFYNIAEVLVFLTRVGVGYGQVNIEASMCNIPILALDSGNDLKWFLKDSCCKDVMTIKDRILSESYMVTKLPKEFDEDVILSSHLNYFNSICER